ncbi:hypothetical protein [Bizionia myxarmorum]|uniref:Uncharacterized protein n=1 Tax=Bizionia myxarmorum TaxID=291186 RepID=A0A5D0R4R0_9FLAO|nr:hypothetical protein [Bizionia myxarmorum]TYB75851.1 hypothetical protein ES674_13595 [Bizionia myxarmorum]
MILKIVVSIISFIMSLGFTILIKPHMGAYVKSEIILNILFVFFTTVGMFVIYRIITKTILKTKTDDTNL